MTQTDKSYVIRAAMPPSLYLITTPTGLFTEEAERHASDWVRLQHLVATSADRAKLCAMGPGALAAHCFPPATSAQAGLLACWMSWLFVLDDRNDEGPQGRMPDVFAGELRQIYQTTFMEDSAATEPLGTALREIWEEVRASMPDFWQQRFHHNMSSFFSACVSQAAHRALNEAPALDTFPQFRRDSGAIWPYFDLIEWVQGYALPPSLYSSHCYQELLTSAADVVCWTNDLLTMEKERAFSDVYNYAFVLQNARSCDLQLAVDKVTERTEERIRAFFRAEAALPWTLHRLKLDQHSQEQVFGTVNMLRAWMRGHVAWGETTGRYGSLAVQGINPLAAARSPDASWL